MKYDFPNPKLKTEFTPGTYGENDWAIFEQACVDKRHYVLPDGEEFAIYKYVERTPTGKRCRWESWYNGKFSNNYFNGFDEAVRWMENYMEFNGIPGKRSDYEVGFDRG